jgi:DNA topoisomerase-1
VTHQGVNATLPPDKTPDTITLAEAVALLDARAERGGGGGSARRRAGARKAAPRKAPSGKKANGAKPARKGKAAGTAAE